MKIFLTGASGFVGSHTMQRLLADPSLEVAVLLRNPGAAWRIRDLLDNPVYREQLRVYTGSLSGHPTSSPTGGLGSVNPGELSVLQKSLTDFRPDAIVHLAWAGVFNADRNSTAQYRNIQQTLELLEMGVASGAKMFLGLGSQAEYGPKSAVISEATETDPTTLYGASKLATCIAAQALAAVLDSRFVWLRLFSSYGPKDNPDWMIPYLIRSLARGERPAVTKGEQRWDYIYVSDVAEAIYAAVVGSKAAGIYNLGSGTACELRTIIETIRDAINPCAEIGFGEVPYRPDQVMHLQADITKLKHDTSWEPRVRLADGIGQVVKWCLANR